MALKYAGLALVAAAALLLGREYTAYLKRRLCECGEFLRLLRHIRYGISVSLMPIPESVDSFSSETLAELGFFDKYKETGSLLSALEGSLETASLDKRAAELIRAPMAALPHLSSRGELSELDKLISELEKYYTAEGQVCDKDIKTALVLISAAALGVIILLI